MTGNNPYGKMTHVKRKYTVLSPIKAPLLIEASPNFEGYFLL